MNFGSSSGFETATYQQALDPSRIVVRYYEAFHMGLDNAQMAAFGINDINIGASLLRDPTRPYLVCLLSYRHLFILFMFTAELLQTDRFHAETKSCRRLTNRSWSRVIRIVR